MNFQTLSRKVNKKLKELQSLSKTRWNVSFNCEILYSLSSSRTLGQFYQKDNKNIIELNKDLLLEFGDLYIEDVFIHEFAHAVVRNLYPSGYNFNKKIKPHGPEFKSICKVFGIDGKATTSLFSNSKTLSSKKRSTKNFTYFCKCNSYQLSTTRHNRILKGTIYKCKNCNSILSDKPY